MNDKKSKESPVDTSNARSDSMTLKHLKEGMYISVHHMTTMHLSDAFKTLTQPKPTATGIPAATTAPAASKPKEK